jgi:hypothetical protein
LKKARTNVMNCGSTVTVMKGSWLVQNELDERDVAYYECSIQEKSEIN